MSESLSTVVRQRGAGTSLRGVARPLDGFYAEAGLALPPLERVSEGEVPEPFRELLVHRNDMTPTLEAFYGCTLELRVLRRGRTGQEYRREVVLVDTERRQPVEFGANRILLTRFSREAQARILEEHEPLGHILRDCAVTHTCVPNAFFRIEADALIRRALELRTAAPLYGRHNRLFDPEGRLLSEVVEVLRPPALTKRGLRPPLRHRDAGS